MLKLTQEYSDGKEMFSATVDDSEESAGALNCLNQSESFENFIKNGASSYTLSTKNNKYSRVDLETDSNSYEPVNAKINANCLDDEWADVKLVFDSAYRAGGKQYKLKHLGLVSE